MLHLCTCIAVTGTVTDSSMAVWSGLFGVNMGLRLVSRLLAIADCWTGELLGHLPVKWHVWGR